MEFEVLRVGAAEAQGEALVVPLFEETKKLQGAAKAVDDATRGMVARLLETDFKGTRGETLVLYPEGIAASRLVLLGLGKRQDASQHQVRLAVASGARKLRELKVAKAAMVLPSVGRGVGAQEVGQAVAEGAILSLYRFTKYKPSSNGHKPAGTPPGKAGKATKAAEAAGNGAAKDEPDKQLDRLTLLAEDAKQVQAAQRGVDAGKVIAESVNFTRDLVNESAQDGTPAAIAKTVQEMAKEVGLTCTVYGKKELEKMGFGALLAVNSGSANEPRFVVLEHKPGGAKPLVFVGKGITFDSGGISIKPSRDMDKMKYDKSGACAVFGAMRAAALMNVPHSVVGICPLTDNLPSGSSYKPGDVVKAYNGKWMEIVNTDAEGRVILSDALSYASKHYPEAAGVIDLATLTGACGIALGNLYIGLMGTDRGLMAKVKQAGERSHERTWELPFDDAYDDYFKSEIAVAKNAGSGMAGTITGGRFLANFVDDQPWVHLDIASTAWDEGAGRARFNGELNATSSGTGVGVRLLVQLLEDWKPTGSGGAARKAKRKG